MAKEPQRAMDSDFLEGIDDKFQRLMNSNGRRSGRTERAPEDRLTIEIMDLLHGLTAPQKEQVLALIHTLKKGG